MIKKEIAKTPDGENIMNCFLCGTCTAGCPVSKIDPAFSPRTIMRMALYGMEKELFSSPEIWKCVQCHVCVAHCPQNARPADVIKAVRQISGARGFFLSAMAFQDAWNIDLERLRDCCIHVVSPDGRRIPFCAYNLTNSQGVPLYRSRR